MVIHVNPFSHICGQSGGEVYKAWTDRGVSLAKQRKSLEMLAWIFVLVGSLAALESNARAYAPLGFIIGGLLVYRALSIRIEEGTIEGVLQQADFDAAIKTLMAQKEEESDRRAYELRRPATDAELTRRAQIIQNLEGKI